MTINQPPAAPGSYGVVRTNTLSIIAVTAGFMMPVAGVVLGVVALSQIRRTGEEGRPLALTGVIAAGILSLFSVAFFIVWLTLFVTMLGHAEFWPPR